VRLTENFALERVVQGTKSEARATLNLTTVLSTCCPCKKSVLRVTGWPSSENLLFKIKVVNIKEIYEKKIVLNRRCRAVTEYFHSRCGNRTTNKINNYALTDLTFKIAFIGEIFLLTEPAPFEITSSNDNERLILGHFIS
jgi:hypothetical protein